MHLTYRDSDPHTSPVLPVNAGEAGAPEIEMSPEIVREMAKALFDALRLSDPSSFINGDPCDNRVTIDGHFNLLAVSKMVLFDLWSRGSIRQEMQK